MNKQRSFCEKHREELSRLAAYYRQQLVGSIMPFWDSRVADTQCGGYYNCFDRAGKLLSEEKYGWFVGRDIYMYSALYHQIEKREEWLRLARHGVEFLKTKALREDDRVNYRMRRDGTPIDGATSIFTDHFAVKALFEYAAASGDTSTLSLAKRMYDRLLDNLTDENVIRRECPDPRFQKHALNFMTLLVAMEGQRFFPEETIPVIDRCLHASLYTFADDREKAPLEYVSAQGGALWEDQGRLVDPGHTMESLWFAMREGEKRGDSAVIRRASEMVDWVIDRAWDQAYGGFYQQVDAFDTVPEKRFRSNRYVDIDVGWDEKIWWVQAEALYTLALSACLTGNEHHFAMFQKLHTYCKDAFSDPVHSEWYSFLHRDGTVKSDRKGFELKGPYHVPRCTMQLALLFERFAGK